MNANACEEFQERLLDLLNDGLEPAEAARVRAHLESCSACREYHAWLAGTTGELEALGDSLVASLPEIDLVDAVLRSVETAPPHVIVPFQPRRFSSLRLSAGLAAAAAILVFGWFVGSIYLGTGHSGAPGATGPAVATLPGERTKPDSQALKKLASSREILAKLEPVGKPSPRAAKTMEATKPPKLGTITFDEVVNARKKAATDGNALAQLVQWATLSREDARALLKRSDLSASTLVGVAGSLDDSDAAMTLLTAVGRYPDNSFLRFQTATKLTDSKRVVSDTGEAAQVSLLAPSTSQDDPATRLTLEQIAAWQNLDPNNALPYYFEADMLLRTGDLAGALDVLRQAQQLNSANVYTMESAQAREAALVAGGMTPETATLLAALTAGNSEYNLLYTLSNDLLEYGRAYAEQNSLTEAQQIFEAVQHMGEQVASSASFSLVESAGLYAQQQALLGLEEIYAALGSEASITQFQDQTMELLMQIEELNRYVSELNTLFSSADDIWNAVADAIMQTGDLNLFGNLGLTGG